MSKTAWSIGGGPAVDPSSLKGRNVMVHGRGYEFASAAIDGVLVGFTKPFVQVRFRGASGRLLTNSVDIVRLELCWFFD